jgi:aconitate hydratase
VRAVLAVSFERTHRTNLIGMGILPLKLPNGLRPEDLRLRPGDLLRIEAPPDSVAPRASVPVAIQRPEGPSQSFDTLAEIETALELELLCRGGIVPFILAEAGKWSAAASSPPAA